ncbi:12746_t:CDS:2 [Funneliformis caledonium]|uniref:12746_t:CDS:1 n=1 Tax=Funneliformis caledonium TaxID=1117310 RepID=A0A9N9CI92_9GLOM|nr:12746_t:CDS:2 [Funneliformis caledonium]
MNMLQLSSETPNATDYIDIIVDIRNLGLLNNLEEHIPKIVVFGNISSGKRSIMTRLTGGLPMPRASTTPYEICILQTEEPIRKITLRYIEDSNRSVIQPREVEFADITSSSKMDVENKLRDAQRYVQNPSIIDINSQLPNDPNNDELPFTKNSVCITIGGPSQNYGLSMVILPSLPESFDECASFTMSLIEECVERDSAILVPIITANADIDTQIAWSLAREVDPDGLRTVGVLTKIDCIPIDDEKHLELANLVKGKREHHIANGFYVIRNRSSVKPEESDDSLESDTFKKLRNHRTWKDEPINKFGLQNFVMKLIELQGLSYKRSWPKIITLLEDKIDYYEEMLNSRPDKPVETPTIRFLDKFDRVFTNHEYVDHKLYHGQQWNFGQLNQALLYTRPRYKLTINEGVTNTEIFDPIKPNPLQFCLKKGLSDECTLDGWSDYSNTQHILTIDQLNEAVQESQGELLDGNFPYTAVISIVEKHQEEWYSISVKFFNKHCDWVAGCIDTLINNTFEEFPNVIRGIKNILHDLLRKCEDETLNRLKDLEEMEHFSANRALYVTDETSLLRKQSKYLTKLQDFAASSKLMNKELKAVLELGSELFDMMYYDENEEEIDTTRKNKDLDKLIRIISTATGALSYWKISYSKYRENVSYIVEHFLVHQFAKNLGIHLRTYFRLLRTEQNTTTDNLNLESLPGEDPSVTSQRAEWQNNVNALYDIIDRVRKLVQEDRKRRPYFKLN